MMAMMMSLAALSIDAVLPALESIGQSFGVRDANDNQLLIGSLFIGMALGQLFFGPLSDSIGRRTRGTPNWSMESPVNPGDSIKNYCRS